MNNGGDFMIRRQARLFEILRNLYKWGNEIVSRTNSSRSEDLHDTGQDPVVWVSV